MAQQSVVVAPGGAPAPACLLLGTLASASCPSNLYHDDSWGYTPGFGLLSAKTTEAAGWGPRAGSAWGPLCPPKIVDTFGATLASV